MRAAIGRGFRRRLMAGPGETQLRSQGRLLATGELIVFRVVVPESSAAAWNVCKNVHLSKEAGAAERPSGSWGTSLGLWGRNGGSAKPGDVYPGVVKWTS